MGTQTGKNATAETFSFELPNGNGRAAAAASRPVVLSTEDLAALTAIEARLATISGNVDGLETLLTAVSGFVDGLEGLQGTANTSLAGLATLITSLNGYVDGLEALQGTTNTSLTSIAGYVDGLEALTTTLNTYVDGLEGLETALSAKLPASLGAKAASASLSVVPAGLEFETVAASQTDQAMGATGAAGDFLSHVNIQPVTTGAGTVTIKSGATTVFTFTAGTLGDLRPITVPIGAFSVGGAWTITTGANVTATAFGDFT